jgi:hypothetical protein
MRRRMTNKYNYKIYNLYNALDIVNTVKLEGFK